MADVSYRAVQPWGRDKAQEATLISDHATAAEAFAEIDQFSAQMVRTGAPGDAVELIVVDCEWIDSPARPCSLTQAETM
jgi:hypothetical protein